MKPTAIPPESDEKNENAGGFFNLNPWLGLALKLLVPGILIFMTASLLHRASDQTSRDEVLRLINDCSPSSLLLSALATAVSFLLLSGSEILGFLSSGTVLAWPRIAKVALISFGVSNTLSLGGVISTSLRFRLYFRNKISSSSILRVTAFSSAGVWIGFFFLLGLCICIRPLSIPAEFHVTPLEIQLLGILSILGTLAYLILAWLQKPVIHLFGHKLTFPSAKFALLQTLFGMTDWTVAALALYVLLPSIEGVGFPRFLSVFLVAQILGNLTSIPGGLGILEVLTVYLLLPNREVTPSVAAALVVYRFIYYVIPLILALFGIAVEEVAESTHIAAIAFRGMLKLTANLIPIAGAAVTAAIGFSLMTFESVGAGTHALPSFPPIILSNLALSVYGFMFFFVADGLRKRSLSAWTFSIFLMTVLTAFLVVMHFSVLSILIPILTCGVLIAYRSEFFRSSRLFDEAFTGRWLLLVCAFILNLLSLALAGFSNVTLAQHTWWNLHLHSSNWIVQIMIPTSMAVAGLSLWRLIVPTGRISSPIPYIPCSVNQAAPIAFSSSVTQSQLVLLGDKTIFTNPEHDTFIMYAIEGKSWIALGDPVTASPLATTLVGDFYRFANRCGGVPVFYQVQPQHLTQYLEFGYQFLKLGEEARVILADFTLQGRSRKSMRNTCNRVEGKNIRFEILPRELIKNHWEELDAVSNSWLKTGRIKEKGFSLGFFDRQYLSHFDFAVLRDGDKITAFANLWKSSDKTELSVDLMRYTENSPSGCMEYLIIKLLEWGKAEGYQSFNLGMAPLSGLELDGVGSPIWNQFGSILYDVGEVFYNFKGVRAFKEKFAPVWEPRYLAYPSAWSLPLVLADVARLITRGGTRTGPEK